MIISPEMNRTDVAILVNSTPKYYSILPFFFGMLRRYAPELRWPVILTTEVPEHPVCAYVAATYGVELLQIPPEQAGFLESRATALQELLARGEFQYVLPLQDDFILEMPMQGVTLQAILEVLDAQPQIASVRLMPCPGPESGNRVVFKEGALSLRELSAKRDPIGFTYQATLWRLGACVRWFSALTERLEQIAPKGSTDPARRLHVEIRNNLAENAEGQALFWSLHSNSIHLGCVRLGAQPNAVYLSPFPYRPTAIVRGALEGWAAELAAREGFMIDADLDQLTF